MEISLEAIDAVRERTGVSYKEAKEALEQTEGSVVDAIVLLEDKSGARTNDVLEKIKALVKEGNVNKIRVKRDDKVLLTVPVNAGIAGGLVGLAVAPWWGVLAAAAAAYGFNCKFEIVKDDGSSTDLGGEE
ncbi:MAG: DUF4342 domain-containing protein [Oscillospiraceae bacterium]|nr:DUF4342 domain-containing protein [Oscillospiraceae bacterium]